MNDNSIIKLFFERNEQAIAESSRAYGGLLKKIAMQIVGNAQDAEECVNDTMLRAWNTIPPEKPEFFRAYLAKLTRNLSLNRAAENHTLRRGGGQTPLVLEELAECISSSENVEQAVDRRACVKAIEEFVRSLPAEHGKVFMRRYFSMIPVSDIAAELELSENTVKSILSRTRAKLQKHLNKEGLL